MDVSLLDEFDLQTDVHCGGIEPKITLDVIFTQDDFEMDRNRQNLLAFLQF